VSFPASLPPGNVATVRNHNSDEPVTTRPAGPGSRRFQPRAVLGWLPWIAILAACYLLAELAESFGVPAAQLLVALVAGAVLALTGVIKRKLPAGLTRSSQALVGALMGSYLDVATLKSVAATVLPLALITVATIGICVGSAYVLSRVTRLTLPDATLGMVPGGSAAIVACAGDVGADARFVAFAQYIRVGLVAFTAPLLVLALHGKADNFAAVATGFPAPGHVIAASGQLSGLVVLAGVCALGGLAGRKLTLPAPLLLGSMIVAALAVATQAVSGFAPAGPLRDLVFVAVGLEVGLRFTRSSVAQIGRLLPHIVGATSLVCVACAGLAAILAMAMGMPFLEAYLATTPGGINAVLATADSTHANVPVISTVQSLRLFAVCLAVPPIVRRLTARPGPAGPAGPAGPPEVVPTGAGPADHRPGVVPGRLRLRPGHGQR
jgi:uncharacterized protein